MLYDDKFPRLKDVNELKKMACDGKLQSVIEVDSFDTKRDGWNATEWIMGLPAMDVLIHEETPKLPFQSLVGKTVTFDDVTKYVKHTSKGQKSCLEIWIPSFSTID